MHIVEFRKMITITLYQFSSVQFSCSVISDSLRPHELRHTRPPCPSPVHYPNSCPLSRSYHPTISSSVVPFSSCLQSFPGPESFPMSQLFTSSGQSIAPSTSASVLPMNRSCKILLFMSKNVPPIFSSRSFRVSGLIFRTLNHFEFIFVYGVGECSNFIDLHVAVQFSQHHRVEETVFSPLYIFAAFVVD